MFRGVVILLALVLSASGLSAKTKDLTSWDPVTSLTKGEKIEVTKKAGGAIQGQLINATPDALSVQTKQGEVTIPRPEIATVGTKPKASNTGKIIGTAIGAAGGLAAGAALGTRLANEGQADKAAITAAGTAIGAAIGLGLGWASNGGYRTIYKGQ